MNRPLISMIVGMYKGEKYIRECIDSVIRQDYTNLEIILVDDGSPDNCGSIADTYAESDSRIVVVHQKNAGVSAARNRALDMAKGDYICIIDQDDVLSTDYVSLFLQSDYRQQCADCIDSHSRKVFWITNFSNRV